MRQKYTGYESAFKGVLAVIAVSLFAAQLSYKFYQYASIPIQGQQVCLDAHGQSLSHAASFSDDAHHQMRSLSLDKRYDLKQVYYLPAAVFCLTPSPADNYIESYIVSQKPVFRTNLLFSLRAPPFIWL